MRFELTGVCLSWVCMQDVTLRVHSWRPFTFIRIKCPSQIASLLGRALLRNAAMPTSTSAAYIPCRWRVTQASRRLRTAPMLDCKLRTTAIFQWLDFLREDVWSVA
eukprot:1623956-Pleurochrysis_carterae.AAC.1